MQKELYQYSTNQIYTKKRNIDSVISIRSVQSNKSSASTKARSNISTTLNDCSTITSFVFNFTSTLLITNMNDSITSSLIHLANPIESNRESKTDTRVFHNLNTYTNSCIDCIDRKIQGALCISSTDELLQEEVLSLCNNQTKKSEESVNKPLIINKSSGNSNSHGSEMKILRMNKKLIDSTRNSSNDTKPNSTKKANESITYFVKRNQRFHSPPVGNIHQSFCFKINEEKTEEKKQKSNLTIKGHCSQITNITPVSIKIKVYNSTNIQEDINTNKRVGNNRSGNSTLKNANATRIMTLPKKATEYVKSSSPKPTLPTEMNKEMNATYLIKPNTQNPSLGLNQKSVKGPESPKVQKKILKRKQSQQESISNQPVLCDNPQLTIKNKEVNQKIISHKQPHLKALETTMKPPLYPKATKLKKKISPQPLANPKLNHNTKNDLNLSCDDIYPKPNWTKKVNKLANSELNKSFDAIKEDFTVFDLNNDIFSVINNSCILIQEKLSKKHSSFNSPNEQEKYSLKVITDNNEILSREEDWERASANFTKEQSINCFDRFSFHNKIIE